MTTIPATLVKDLRERTGAGMMECKKALQASNGDIEKAIESMRKSGQAKADKKAGRIAAEGVILIKQSADNLKAAIVEVNCETDFVARDDGFKTFSGEVVELALNNQVNNVDTLSSMKSQSNADLTIDQLRQNLIAKIGENIRVRRLQFVESATPLVSYIHSGRIGVLVQIEGGDEALAKDVAMHIAASKPIVIHPEDIPQDVVDKERDIFIGQAEQEGKPKEIAEKMVVGKLAKFTNAQSLVGQAFVKDPDTSVGKLLESNSAKVLSFVRFEVGEGIEKKQEDFAEEVMAQVRESE